MPTFTKNLKSNLSENFSRRLAIIYMAFWATVLYLRIFNMVFFARQVKTGFFSWGQNIHFHHFIVGFILLAVAILFEIFGNAIMEISAIFFGISLGLIADECLYWISFNFNYWNFYNYIGIVFIGVILLLLYIAAAQRENEFRLMPNGAPTRRKNPQEPKLSVVIPAYNESLFLNRALQSLAKQSFQDFEIIVVDNNSTDSTAEVAKSFGARVITEKKQGVANARQTGFLAARGEIIASTDADTFLPVNWTQRIADEFAANSKLVGFGGLYSLYSGPLSATLVFPDFAYLFWLVDRKFHKTWALTGSNMAVAKSAFLACGGFNTSIHVGEDADLAQKLASHGELKFDRNFLVSTSGRRYRQGLFKGASAYLKKYKRVREISGKTAELSSQRSEKPHGIPLLLPMIPAIILIFIFSAQSQAFAKSALAARRTAREETAEFTRNHPQAAADVNKNINAGKNFIQTKFKSPFITPWKNRKNVKNNILNF